MTLKNPGTAAGWQAASGHHRCGHRGRNERKESPRRGRAARLSCRSGRGHLPGGGGHAQMSAALIRLNVKATRRSASISCVVRRRADQAEIATNAGLDGSIVPRRCWSPKKTSATRPQRIRDMIKLGDCADQGRTPPCKTVRDCFAAKTTEAVVSEILKRKKPPPCLRAAVWVVWAAWRTRLQYQIPVTTGLEGFVRPFLFWDE